MSKIYVLILLVTGMCCQCIIAGTQGEFISREPMINNDAKSVVVALSKSKRNDPALQKEMKSLLISSKNEAWRGEILTIVIIDKDWFIERHKITGAILYRYIRAEVVVKNGDDCWLYNLVTFKQDYIDTNYEKTYWDGIGDKAKISCEEIN